MSDCLLQGHPGAGTGDSEQAISLSCLGFPTPGMGCTLSQCDSEGVVSSTGRCSRFA